MHILRPFDTTFTRVQHQITTSLKVKHLETTRTTINEKNIQQV